MFCYRTHVVHHLQDPSILLLLLILIFKGLVILEAAYVENKGRRFGCRKEEAMLTLILVNESFHPGSLISAQFPPIPSCLLSQAHYHPEICGLCAYNGLSSNPAGWCKTCIFFLSLSGCLGRVQILYSRGDFYWSQVGWASLGCFFTSGWLRNNALCLKGRVLTEGSWNMCLCWVVFPVEVAHFPAMRSENAGKE